MQWKILLQQTLLFHLDSLLSFQTWAVRPTVCLKLCLTLCFKLHFSLSHPGNLHHTNQRDSSSKCQRMTFVLKASKASWFDSATFFFDTATEPNHCHHNLWQAEGLLHQHKSTWCAQDLGHWEKLFSLAIVEGTWRHAHLAGVRQDENNKRPHSLISELNELGRMC